MVLEKRWRYMVGGGVSPRRRKVNSHCTALSVSRKSFHWVLSCFMAGPAGRTIMLSCQVPVLLLLVYSLHTVMQK